MNIQATKNGIKNSVENIITSSLFSEYDFAKNSWAKTLISSWDIYYFRNAMYTKVEENIANAILRLARKCKVVDNTENFIVNESTVISIGDKSNIGFINKNVKEYETNYKQWLERPYFNQITIKLED